MGTAEETRKEGEPVSSERAFSESLKVGQCAFMQVGQDDASQRQRTTIRGWDKGKSILLDKPAGDGQPLPRKGQRCAVRYIHEGVVWGFRCLVTECPSNSKVRHFGVAWPERIYQARIRSEARIEAWISCRATLPNGRQAAGTLCDISGGGCRVELKDRLEKGESFALTFVLPDEVLVEKAGVLIHRRIRTADGGYGYGCEFVDLPSHAADSIRLWSIREQLSQRGRKTECLVVVTRHLEDVHRVEGSLGKHLGLTTVPATMLLDVGYWLHEHHVRGVFVNMRDCHFPAEDIRTLIRTPAHEEDPPVVAYGNGHDMPASQPEAKDGLFFLNDLAECARMSSIFAEKTEKAEDECLAAVL